MSETPRTLYTWNDGWGLAYQVTGNGPDLVYLPPFAASIDWTWRNPSYARFLRRLASFARLTLMDRRGWGCSDRFPPGAHPDLGALVDDLLAVVAAASASRATLLASQDGAYVALETVAQHPRAFSSLILYQSSPVWTRKDDMPWEQTDDDNMANIRSVERSSAWDEWNRTFIRDQLPSIVGDEAEVDWLSTGTRSLMGPGSLVAEMKWLNDIDLRPRLPDITIPTLILHRPASRSWPIEASRYMAERIPGARLVELPGADNYPWVGEWEAVTDEVQEFMTGSRERVAPRRSLATILFTDMIDSTVRAADLGDAAWRRLLERHRDVVRAVLRRHGGAEVETAGDGFLATFETAAEAVRAALAMIVAVQPLGVELRAGVHTGEVERDGPELRGIAVHVAARVMAAAGPSEVFASSTVKDLTAGSGLVYEDRGDHELKGVPDRWRLFAATGG